MLEFEFVGRLWLLFLVPLIAYLFAISERKRRNSFKLLASQENFKRLVSGYSPKRDKIKFVLFVSALALLIVAWANPRVGTRLRDAKHEGTDIVIALDVSQSMMAQDVKPSRLEMAKHSISKLLDKLNEDRVALIIFAGRANVLFPLTSDFGAAKMFLSTVEPDFISEQGTAIAEALSIATRKFETDANAHKALILISDGEDHEQNAIDEAELARKTGFTVFTIGMGSPEGAPIPVTHDGIPFGWLKDEQGSTVISKLNADMLSKIASAGGGKFIRSYANEPDLNELTAGIATVGKSVYGSGKFSEYESFAPYLFVSAFLILIAECLIPRKKSRKVVSKTAPEAKQTSDGINN